MTESHDVLRRAIDAAGAKRVAQALGLSLGYTYRFARHPMDPHDPDGTGAANPLDRIEALAELLAVRPEGRPILVELQRWFGGLFDRLLSDRAPERLTVDRFHAHVGQVMKEAGEAVAKCQSSALACAQMREGLRRELAEAIAALTSLDAALATAEPDSRVEPALRRIG